LRIAGGSRSASGVTTIKYLAIGTGRGDGFDSLRGSGRAVERQRKDRQGPRSILAQQMGAPKQAVPMTDTGSEELFYSF
jgi:hypothetical protein